MDSSEYFRIQNAALAEVQRLTDQMEAGEIEQSDAEQQIIAIMQTLERDTADYLPQQRAKLTRQRLLFRLAPWAILVVFLAVLAYRAWA